MSDSIDEALVKLNVTAGAFQFLAQMCEAIEWIAQGEPWRNMQAIDLSFEMSDFFAGVENATESAPQLAEHFGTTTERAQYAIDWFNNAAGWPLPSVVEEIKRIFPNVGTPENNSDLFIGILVLLSVLAAVFVGLRVYSRIVVNGFIRAHDYILITATLIAFVFGLAGPTHYRGKWNRSWEDKQVDLWSGKFTEVMYPTGILFIKSSLLLFYWGLTTWWPLRTGVAVVFVVCFGNTLAMILTAVLKCNPAVSSFEGYDYFTATCNVDLWAKGEEICGSINIATDIIIWLMPLPMVWKITQGMRERFLACVTFGLGALACIACGMRFSKVQEYNVITLIPRDQSRWLLWALVEMFLAIICSCVPAIRALVIKRAPAFIGSTVTDTTYDKDDRDDKSTDKEKDKIININSESV
ncbi:hypothetical protein ABW19_dt0208446 [Dactylella cylindrospora]|nr:hypothetical protein ABW19_dt0208446 [Dactylella cylindrospora]